MSALELTTSAADRVAQAVAHLRQAMLLIEPIVPGAFKDIDHGTAAALLLQPVIQTQPAAPSGNGTARPLVTDRTTFCAHWADQTCHLGNTMAFKLLERLARRPNHLVHCNLLLDELWEPHTSYDAVRSAVKILRRKLRAAGMGDLAKAIDGSTAHHYGLMLNGWS